MEHTSRIELSRSALKNNFDYLHRVLGTERDIVHVVKGNAYGHGINRYVPLAQELGAFQFATFDAYEALQVHQATNENRRIMIMGMITNDQLEWAIENDIEFFVFEKDRLEHAVKAAQKIKKPAQIHIEIETGMNRTGFEKDTLEQLKPYLKTHQKHLRLMGFCTHYAGAESIANFIRVNEQFDRFNTTVQTLREAGINAEQLHTACSAAAVRLPRTRMDLMRIGILQYGFWPSMETFIATTGKENGVAVEDPLRRIISWKSRIMSIKKVGRGHYIGYGTSYLATSDITVAQVPVGYAHGFSRSLSNQGRALVRGIRVQVIGIVNMNVMLLDVSGMDPVEKGDEVVLIGTQGDLSISVSSFSEYSDQLNYELLTRLPHDIPRYIVD